MLTETQANAHGFRLVRGAYAGTTDNRIDRWYLDDAASSVVDRRGAGFRTKRAALEHLTEVMLGREQ